MGKHFLADVENAARENNFPSGETLALFRWLVKKIA
jgi:hypothetical protein